MKVISYTFTSEIVLTTFSEDINTQDFQERSFRLTSTALLSGNLLGPVSTLPNL